MADEGDFKIKGAAKASQESPELLATASEKQSTSAADIESEDAEESKKTLEDGEVAETQEELLATHKWFKCLADSATYGPNQYYYINSGTQESRWTEPEEPYWVYDQTTGTADSSGLQYPKKMKPSDLGGEEESRVEEEYMGYNPKIHGDYDPNADYAQWHNKKREEEAAAADPYNTLTQTGAPGVSGYEAIMTLNRFTGSAQSAGLNPERHGDAARSARQMSAFFDVDAAANAHEGRSLKEERQAQRLTREQVQAFNKARQEKKKKKRMEFYKS